MRADHDTRVQGVATGIEEPETDMSISHRTLNRALALAGALLAAPLVVSPASAQFFARPFFHGGIWHGEVVVPAPVPRRAIGMGAMAILDDLEERGFRNLAIVTRRPDVFVIDAIDQRRQSVRLVVDAYDGEILERFPRDRAVASRSTEGNLSGRRDLPRGTRPDDKPRLETPRVETPKLEDKAKPEDKPRAQEAPKAEETRRAELPTPPRRPAGPAATAPVGNRPAPVAPARNPADWAPINSVPVAPLE